MLSNQFGRLFKFKVVSDHVLSPDGPSISRVVWQKAKISPASIWFQYVSLSLGSLWALNVSGLRLLILPDCTFVCVEIV
jgi:hypothetical protein